jgi:hypothetical protein
MRAFTGPSVGAGLASSFEKVARSHVVPLDIEASYRGMAVAHGGGAEVVRSP